VVDQKEGGQLTSVDRRKKNKKKKKKKKPDAPEGDTKIECRGGDVTWGLNGQKKNPFSGICALRVRVKGNLTAWSALRTANGKCHMVPRVVKKVQRNLGIVQPVSQEWGVGGPGGGG